MNRLAKFTRMWQARRNFRHRQGIAALEFALTLPVWITLILGMGDGAYYLLVNEKSDRIAYSVTDIVTQYQTVTIANLNDIVSATSQLMKPFPFSSQGVVIITSIYKPSGQTAKICWQYTGGGSLVQTSKIGTTGGVPTLPQGLQLNDNENVIVSEVFYNFSPLFVGAGTFDSFGASALYHIAVYKPRLSQLINQPS